MVGREPDTKVPKASAVQEQSPSKITCSSAAAYPNCSGFQAYSPMFPHGFFHSPMTSIAQTHPFIWGAQHFMPPYGTPAPPYVMYPHGVYAHPSGQPELEAKMGDRQESLDERSQNGTRGITIVPTWSTSHHTVPMMPMPVAGATGVVAVPTTNLNIGMEHCVSSTSSAISPENGKVPATMSAGTVVPGALVDANENVQPEIWLQDERELKRQRRKQSNRESARRSRLRKQAEYEELAPRVEVLKEENTALRAEVEQIKKEFNELLAQNASLQERIEEEIIEEGSIIEKRSLHAETDATRTLDSDSEAAVADKQNSH